MSEKNKDGAAAPVPVRGLGVKSLAPLLGTSEQNLYQLILKHKPMPCVVIEAGSRVLYGYDLEYMRTWYAGIRRGR